MTGNAMTKPATHHWTYEDYLVLPDDGTRCEIIEGERLMTPAPSFRHQNALGNLFAMLLAHVRNSDVGHVLLAPFDVILANDTVVQPDILVVTPGRPGLQDRGLFEAPDLAVEILSPSTAERDLDRKMRIYSRHGVREYWIVDPIAQWIEVYVLEGRTFARKARHESGEVRSLVVLPGFSVKLADVFKT